MNILEKILSLIGGPFIGPEAMHEFANRYFGDPKKIRDIGDGTATGAIESLNNSLTGVTENLDAMIRTTNVAVAGTVDANGILLLRPTFTAPAEGYSLITWRINQATGDKNSGGLLAGFAATNSVQVYNMHGEKQNVTVRIVAVYCKNEFLP